jgi:hypothetical protein
MGWQVGQLRAENMTHYDNFVKVKVLSGIRTLKIRQNVTFSSVYQCLYMHKGPIGRVLGT